jgi:hypothetical protein
MFAHVSRGDHPRDCGKRPVSGVRIEIRDRFDVAELIVVLDRVEVRQRLQIPGVRGSWRTGAQLIALSFWQSGSVPVVT